MDLFKPAFRIGQFVMLLWGGAMLLPLTVADGDLEQLRDFGLSALCCFALAGLLARLGRGFVPELKPRALFLVTFINWLLLSLTGALPFQWSELHMSFADALFESVSGITTTGSTVMTGLDAAPRSLLLWRSISQWVGGIGIILMAVAVLPFLKVGGMRLFRTESSEWSLLDHQRINRIALQIAVAYATLTLLCLSAFRLFGMSWFDAVNHAFSTLSTGGYSTADASFGKFDSPALHWTATFFMLLGGCPFLLLVYAFKQRTPRPLLADSQVRLLLTVVATAVLAVTAWRAHALPEAPLGDLLTHGAFNLVSIITTTGFASQDYSQWGSFPVMIFTLLMFTGACSGSTSGGVKLFRYQLLALFVKENSFTALHPNARVVRYYNGRPVQEEVLVSSLAYLFCMVGSWAACSVLLALFGLDSVTSITASLTALMNVGPGFGEIVGPAGNFSSLPDSAKYVLTAAMLLGRLEYLALIVVFTREFWRW